MVAGRFQGNLPDRTFEFAVKVLDLVEQMPDGTIGWVLGKQLARSGTSIGANVSEADQGFTDAEFAHRCSIARKEASETHYWLRLCQRKRLLTPAQTTQPLQECQELSKILTTIVKKCQANAK